jgi:hypothetical protein
VLTKALHWCLASAWSIQSISPHPIFLRSIIILSYHLHLGLPSSLFPSGFPTNTLYAFLFAHIRARLRTWRPLTENIEAKAFIKFIRTYCLFRSERLSDNIKLTLHKALIRSVMTYACPAWELAADTYLLILRRLQNKVLRTIRNFPSCTPVCDLHMTFNLPYVDTYITKLCRQQAEVIQNHKNELVRRIRAGQGEARHRKRKRLKLGVGEAYDRSSD